MTQTLLMLKGLPGSGKTTFARDLVNGLSCKDIKYTPTNTRPWKRVNKDDLRAMLDNSKHSDVNEELIITLRDAIIWESLVAGFNVVVDDTNFAEKHEKTLSQYVDQYNVRQGAANEVFGIDGPAVDFEVLTIDTPVDVCINRDSKREKPVGSKVILQMYRTHVNPSPAKKTDVAQYYVPPENGIPAIMCDIDGTLAHMTENGRLRFGKQAPYMWYHVGEDDVDPVVKGLVNTYATYDNLFDRPVKILLVSGRSEAAREGTEKWLAAHDIHYDKLFMRADSDNRSDDVVKSDIFDQLIRDTYKVLFVLDDRNKVVKMWRQLGLKVLQVAEGDF